VAVFCARFQSPSGHQVIGDCLQRVGGTALDSTWERSFSFPPGVEPGLWHLADGWVFVDDLVGNAHAYLESELIAQGFSTTLLVNATPKIVSTSPARLWVGLKNSDDQGTRFDLRAALYVNDTLVAEGETHCVTGITRNRAMAREVAVPFGPISNGEAITGDRLTLKVFTRIGTNPDGSKCPGHSNAIGLRLYYDSVTRPSGFGAEITPGPLANYFLRSINGDLTLDTASPTAAEAEQKDSGPVTFARGNAWVRIGAWTHVVQ
jgi:hypothetical protein